VSRAAAIAGAARPKATTFNIRLKAPVSRMSAWPRKASLITPDDAGTLIEGHYDI
jgi:hypothetical protein